MRETDLNKKETFSPRVPGYPLKIGGVETENPIWLAPLAGITFASVRKFYRSSGCRAGAHRNGQRAWTLP